MRTKEESLVHIYLKSSLTCQILLLRAKLRCISWQGRLSVCTPLNQDFHVSAEVRSDQPSSNDYWTEQHLSQLKGDKLELRVFSSILVTTRVVAATVDGKSPLFIVE